MGQCWGVDCGENLQDVVIAADFERRKRCGGDSQSYGAFRNSGNSQFPYEYHRSHGRSHGRRVDFLEWWQGDPSAGHI